MYADYLMLMLNGNNSIDISNMIDIWRGGLTMEFWCSINLNLCKEGHITDNKLGFFHTSPFDVILFWMFWVQHQKMSTFLLQSCRNLWQWNTALSKERDAIHPPTFHLLWDAWSNSLSDFFVQLWRLLQMCWVIFRVLWGGWYLGLCEGGWI